MTLQNKVALITGGAMGIGFAVSEHLAEQGARIVIADLNNAQAAAEKLKQKGHQAIGVQANVAEEGDTEHMAKAALDAFGQIDILVNNAGIAHVGNLEGTAEEDMDQIYNVNIKGVYNCMHAVISKMKEKGGVILNMASIASSVGISDRFAYSMSKGAVLTMTYSVAKDYLDNGIRCNSISPARIHTPFVDGFIKKNYPGKEEEMFEKLSKSQPIGRMGKPEEVANLAVYLCSDEASFITGTDFPIDGGYIKLNG